MRCSRRGRRCSWKNVLPQAKTAQHWRSPISSSRDGSPSIRRCCDRGRCSCTSFTAWKNGVRSAKSGGWSSGGERALLVHILLLELVEVFPDQLLVVL